MKKFTIKLLAIILTLFTTLAFAALPMQTDTLVPTGKGWGVPTKNAPAVTVAGNGIDYHGGPVMGTPGNYVIVYYLLYGDWSNSTEYQIITNFIKNIGKHAYYKINTTYYDSNNNHVGMNNVLNGGGTTDKYSLGKSLTFDTVSKALTNALDSGRLPFDERAVYMILTSADVNVEGFCSQYCGWHTAAPYKGKYIKYALIGNAKTQCPGGCIFGYTNSPNNNAGIDGMISIIAHELVETVTDPLINAWYDKDGQENADKCSWNFGPTQNAPNDARYNMTVGTMKYLVQQNWVNANGGYCAQGLS